MRVSVIPGDKDYHEPPVPVDAYLDGEQQFHVFWADEEAGQLSRAVLDGEGRVQANPNAPDEIWGETVSGRVELVWRHAD